eukprot:3895936-Rhodomonas_salina.1
MMKDVITMIEDVSFVDVPADVHPLQAGVVRLPPNAPGGLSATLRSASAGMSIILEDGTFYETEPMTICKPGIRISSSSGSSKIFGSFAGTGSLLRVEAKDVLLQDIQFERVLHGDVGDQEAACPDVSCLSIGVDSDVRIEKCTIRAKHAIGIEVCDSSSPTIEACTFEDVSFGIFVGGRAAPNIRR